MPFSSGMLIPGRPVYQLTDTGGEGVYNVEAKLLAQYGVASAAWFLIIVVVTGERKASTTSGLAIDGSGLHPNANLVIDLQSANVNGRGGDGGRGGDLTDVPPITPLVIIPPGDGGDGGDAISLGCDTTIKGTGVIRCGFGGGSGGAASQQAGGGGGGGGAPYGLLGGRGRAIHITFGTNYGNDGNNATEDTAGAGGVAVATATEGGDGGDDGGAAEAKEANAGTAGYTVAKNGFTLTKTGSVTYEGSEGT